MSIIDQAQQLARAGRTPEAVALVERAAEANDAEAQFALGNWRLFGLNGPRDLKKAHELLRRAGEKANALEWAKRALDERRQYDHPSSRSIAEAEAAVRALQPGPSAS